MTTPEQTVRRFIAAWNAMDFDAIIDGLAQDIYYHNMPMEPVVGIDGVREYLRSAWTFSEWTASGNICVRRGLSVNAIGSWSI